MVETGLVDGLDSTRFWRLAHLGQTTFGLDRRWLSRDGALIVLLLAAASLSSQSQTLPLAVRLVASVLMVLAVVATSCAHELGHLVAGRLAGLDVKAVVVGPHGGMTIRASAHDPFVDACTALSGPLVNALLASVLFAAALHADAVLGTWLVQLAAIQAITAVINLLPLGTLDGARIRAALVANRAAAV